MSFNIEKFAQTGNRFVQDVAERIGEPENTAKAARVMRAVFHSLRNRITPEESLQLVAQLPMFLKAVYVDGWKLSKMYERIKHVTDFIDEVSNEAGRTGLNDFSTNDEALKLI